MTQRIFELYYQGTYIWQIAEILDITEAEVVATLGL
jgi:transposase-like protein